MKFRFIGLICILILCVSLPVLGVDMGMYSKNLDADIPIIFTANGPNENSDEYVPGKPDEDRKPVEFKTGVYIFSGSPNDISDADMRAYIKKPVTDLGMRIDYRIPIILDLKRPSETPQDPIKAEEEYRANMESDRIALEKANPNMDMMILYNYIYNEVNIRTYEGGEGLFTDEDLQLIKSAFTDESVSLRDTRVINGIATFIGLSYERMGLERPMPKEDVENKYIWNSLDIYDRLYGQSQPPIYIYVAIAASVMLICGTTAVVIVKKRKKSL